MRGERNERSERDRGHGSKNPQQIHDGTDLQQGVRY
jgi:hypothetical protein